MHAPAAFGLTLLILYAFTLFIVSHQLIRHIVYGAAIQSFQFGATHSFM
jgi:hypothetical protein